MSRPALFTSEGKIWWEKLFSYFSDVLDEHLCENDEQYQDYCDRQCFMKIRISLILKVFFLMWTYVEKYGRQGLPISFNKCTFHKMSVFDALTNLTVLIDIISKSSER